MFPAKLVIAFSACCLGAALAQEVSITPAPGTASPAAQPAAGASDATAAAKLAEPTAPSLLQSFKKTAFSRTSITSLREWAGVSLDEAKPSASAAPPVPSATTPLPGAATPAPDANAPLLKTLRKDVAMGNWKAVGVFLTEHFKDKPDDAKE